MATRAGRTIRMSPVNVVREHERLCGRNDWRWQVDPTDPANGNADVTLQEAGYPSRIKPDEFGYLILAMARAGVRVIFEPLPAETETTFYSRVK